VTTLTATGAPAQAMNERAHEACPKCRRPCAPGDRACARCGLLARRFAAYAAALAAEEAAEPPELSRAWSACRERWSEPALHDAALDAATKLERLPALARRYREALDRDPADEVAARRLAQLKTLIETAARAQARAVDSPGAARALWAMGYLFAAAIFIASLWAAAIALRRHG